ncbi:MAG: protein-export membrane protein SecD [Bdellovibrionales bacterium RIFOXYB1_FULL_37_110]|nr:MAG: protein-export membrane protein SecD [Bdellovibrionales bacterium RIFOXYC1_FULL_37_79]OFZ59344.1 MAG: protein-export membrane protein SecD [Bdellovibrionales bacterium RIFOXYB1_FULL_37_110]OFZ61904.1 MAG: protein-export membrane protein SecD [Bdellovibrionales bacterium RIFOXYD1_FULL_36_51]
MNRGWWYRFIFLLVVTIVSIFAIIPTVFKHAEDVKFPVKSKISLGLDLQGGLYMILGIDFNNVYRDEIKSWTRKIETKLKEDNINSTMGEIDLSDPEDPKHKIEITNGGQVAEAEKIIKDYFKGVIRLTSEDGNVLTYGLMDSWRKHINENSVTKSIEVIRNRIDEFGVTEPEIISQGKDRIIVQLPGVKDIDRAKELIGKTAKLEFKMVNDTIPASNIMEWLKKAKDAKIEFKKGMRFSDYLNSLNEFLKNDFPKDYQLAFQKPVGKVDYNETDLTPYLVDVSPRLTGEDLQDARVNIDQQKNQPYVGMEFKTSGAKIFEEVTGENVGKRLAVILDGNVYTAPNIQARIAGGHAQITLGAGSYNKIMKEARDIALVLRAGALPVQLDFLEQRIIGPSLGQDSIKSATMATIIGSLIVFIFALIYYRISGLIAVVCITLNILFIMACLVGFEATLTLPGIAGMALTVGMAIDGSIIIFERIREEIRKGIGNYKAVEEGFSNAFWTIIDANVTTAFAGLCLLNFGTGPIRGFAVTLLIGIVATVYTSYFVGKLLFEFYMNKVEGQDLSI